MKTLFLLSLVCLFLVSCEKEEKDIFIINQIILPDTNTSYVIQNNREYLLHFSAYNQNKTTYWEQTLSSSESSNITICNDSVLYITCYSSFYSQLDSTVYLNKHKHNIIKIW